MTPHLPPAPVPFPKLQFFSQHSMTFALYPPSLDQNHFDKASDGHFSILILPDLAVFDTVDIPTHSMLSVGPLGFSLSHKALPLSFLCYMPSNTAAHWQRWAQCQSLVSVYTRCWGFPIPHSLNTNNFSPQLHSCISNTLPDSPSLILKLKLEKQKANSWFSHISPKNSAAPGSSFPQ